MVLPGHLAGGYLATTALISLTGWSFSINELNTLYIIGALAGEIPDIDLFAFYFENKFKTQSKEENGDKSHTHRKYFTHTPLFWIIASLSISILGMLFSSIFTFAIGLVILVGTMSHFILDSIDYGITWLKPFSQKRFSIFPMETIVKHSPNEIVGSLSYYWNYLKSTYLKQATFYAEFLITVIALYFLIK